jgi:putative methyltransferase (TIGR04325 family)
VKKEDVTTFSGQYLSFKEVLETRPMATNYHSENSLQDVVNSAKDIVSKFKQGQLVSSGWETSRLNILPTFLSSAHSKDKALKILDVGGGLGEAYMNLRASIPAINCDYTILELDETVREGAALFSDFADVRFISEFPHKIGVFDLVLFGSSLQYFEDYATIIKWTCDLKPEAIILTDFPMGIVKTFVCAQVNMLNRVIPMNVCNLEEIVCLFGSYGYAVASKTVSYYSFHDFSNYDNDASRTNFYNLIFRKIA